jgi:hypothetical protein
MRTLKLRYAFKPYDVLLAFIAVIVVATLGHWAFLAAVLVLVARDNLTFTLTAPAAEREAEEVVR